MRKNALNLLIVTVLALGLAAGCDKKAEGGGEGKGGEAKAEPSAKSPFAGFDPAAELKALQGKWKVTERFGQKEPDTWTIEGDKVTKVGPKGEKKGTLAVTKPGELAVKEGDMTSYLAYARNGSDIWIGLGTGGVKAGDTYYVGEDRGVVAFDGKTCKYHKQKMSFGGGPKTFEAPTDVKCSVATEGDKTILKYQAPDPFKKGELGEASIEVIGTALVNEQLGGSHKVVKAE